MQKETKRLYKREAKPEECRRGRSPTERRLKKGRRELSRVSKGRKGNWGGKGGGEGEREGKRRGKGKKRIREEGQKKRGESMIVVSARSWRAWRKEEGSDLCPSEPSTGRGIGSKGTLYHCLRKIWVMGGRSLPAGTRDKDVNEKEKKRDEGGKERKGGKREKREKRKRGEKRGRTAGRQGNGTVRMILDLG